MLLLLMIWRGRSRRCRCSSLRTSLTTERRGGRRSGGVEGIRAGGGCWRRVEVGVRRVGGRCWGGGEGLVVTEGRTGRGRRRETSFRDGTSRTRPSAVEVALEALAAFVIGFEAGRVVGSRGVVHVVGSGGGRVERGGWRRRVGVVGRLRSRLSSLMGVGGWEEERLREMSLEREGVREKRGS